MLHGYKVDVFLRVRVCVCASLFVSRMRIVFNECANGVVLTVCVTLATRRLSVWFLASSLDCQLGDRPFSVLSARFKFSVAQKREALPLLTLNVRASTAGRSR